MGRIVTDPYFVQSPLGEGIQKLGEALIHGAQNAYKNRYYQAEADALERKQQGISELAGVVGAPTFDQGNVPKILSAAVRAGRTGQDMGDVLRTVGYALPDTPQATRERMYVGAGGQFGGTETGHNQTLANAIQRANIEQGGAMARTQAEIASREKLAKWADDRTTTPVMMPGENGGKEHLALRPKSLVMSPMFVGTPILQKDFYSPTRGQNGEMTLQPNMPGLNIVPSGGSLRNVQRPDGTVTMTNDPTGRFDNFGQPIPQGSTVYTSQTPDTGNAELGGLRASNQNLDMIEQQVNDIRNAYRRSPASMGAVGNFRDMLQNMLQQGEMAGRTLGFKTQEIRDAVAKYDPALAGQFDPNLPLVDQKRKILTYLIGSELFGQSGHALSNKDFKQVEGIIGGEDLLANPAEMDTKLESIMQMVNQKRAANAARLQQSGRVPGGAAGSPGAAPAPAPAGGGTGVPTNMDVDAELRRRGLVK